MRLKPSMGLVAVAAALILIIGGGFAAAAALGSPTKTITVDFDKTISLYEGSQVRILGVPVGTVTKIEPRGTTVRATLEWDDSYPVPADVKAVVVSPSIVGDRYVQLTPAYPGGPQIKAGAHLDQTSTETPVELDETYKSLNDLNKAFGPQGANKDGSVGDLLDSAASLLNGQGDKINGTISSLSKTAKTFDDNKGPLFETVTQVQSLAEVLATNDGSVRELNSSLAQISQVLADERGNLSATLRILATTLATVRTYVEENETNLNVNIKNFSSIAKNLAANKDQLAQVLEDAPTAIVNAMGAYNPATGTLDTRPVISKGTSATGPFPLLTQDGDAQLFLPAYCTQTPVYQGDPDGTGAAGTPYGSICDVVDRLIAKFIDPRTGSPANSEAASEASLVEPGGLESLMGVA